MRLDDYNYLSEFLLKKVLCFLPNLEKSHIVLCFRREKVDLERLVSLKRGADCIKHGYFINTVSDDAKFIVPDVSTFLVPCILASNSKLLHCY